METYFVYELHGMSRLLTVENSYKCKTIKLGQVKKKKMFLVRISIKKRGGRFFLFFIISYCMLSLHIMTFPQGYVGALRSNINKTKHQILIKHKFNFDTYKGLTVKIYIVLVCTKQQLAVIRTPS